MSKDEKKICAKCGREILSSEKAYVFEGEIVCAECDGKLRGASQVATMQTASQTGEREPAGLGSAAADIGIEGKYKGVGGWLLLFCILLTIINPIVSIGSALRSAWLLETSGSELSLSGVGFVITSDPIVAIALALFGCSVGIKLWKVKLGAVAAAQQYLRYVLGWAVFRGAVLAKVDAGVLDMTLGTLLGYLIWSTYLKKSKRVHATYPPNLLEE